MNNNFLHFVEIIVPSTGIFSLAQKIPHLGLIRKLAITTSRKSVFDEMIKTKLNIFKLSF